jgi:hypothetical protein
MHMSENVGERRTNDEAHTVLLSCLAPASAWVGPHLACCLVCRRVRHDERASEWCNVWRGIDVEYDRVTRYWNGPQRVSERTNG